MNVLLVIIAVFAVLTVPALYLAEWRLGSSRWIKVVRGVLAAGGALTVLLDSLLLNHLASNFRTPYLGDWVKDFYFGYMWASLPWVLVLTGLLCLAAAIRHPMAKIRRFLAVLVSLAAVLTAFAVAFFAVNDDFAVDLYIKVLGIGMALLPHAVSLCERGEKTSKN